MSWQLITLITPTDNINVNGKVIDIHNIEIVKIDKNGGLTFIEKQPPVPLTEKSGLFDLDDEDKNVEKAAIEDFREFEEKD
jgi:hypothetical protein